MSEYRVRITAGEVACTATLHANSTARAIWNALPIEGRANLWGDEIYFEIPIDLSEEDARAEVAVGDLAYWPPGTALCIFWGATPASRGTEPRAASPVNVFGRIDDDATALGNVKSGTLVRVEALESK
jgi:uncharacterized protein